VPELVALDLPALVAAGYPGTAAIPAVNYLLSLQTSSSSHAVGL
jgi:hypothetical protein